MSAISDFFAGIKNVNQLIASLENGSLAKTFEDAVAQEVEKVNMDAQARIEQINQDAKDREMQAITALADLKEFLTPLVDLAKGINGSSFTFNLGKGAAK